MLKIYLSSILIYLILFIAYKVIAYFVVDKEKMRERHRMLESIVGTNNKKANWFYALAISAIPVIRLAVLIGTFAITLMSDKKFEELLESLKEE